MRKRQFVARNRKAAGARLRTPTLVQGLIQQQHQFSNQVRDQSHWVFDQDRSAVGDGSQAAAYSRSQNYCLLDTSVLSFGWR